MTNTLLIKTTILVRVPVTFGASLGGHQEHVVFRGIKTDHLLLTPPGNCLSSHLLLFYSIIEAEALPLQAMDRCVKY